MVTHDHLGMPALLEWCAQLQTDVGGCALSQVHGSRVEICMSEPGFLSGMCWVQKAGTAVGGATLFGILSARNQDDMHK